jgi:hypothetical protein
MSWDGEVPRAGLWRTMVDPETGAYQTLGNDLRLPLPQLPMDKLLDRLVKW